MDLLAHYTSRAESTPAIAAVAVKRLRIYLPASRYCVLRLKSEPPILPTSP